MLSEFPFMYTWPVNVQLDAREARLRNDLEGLIKG